MYTAPPSGDDDAQNDETAETEASDAAPETPELDATTDANWTGTVPADD